MKTLKDLKEHMTKYQDAVVILGSDAIKSCGLKPFDENEYKENMTRKNLVRKPDAFWNFYDNYYFNDPDNITYSYSQVAVIKLYELGLIKNIVTLSTEGMLRDCINHDDLIEFHGSMRSYKCQKCKTVYSYDSIYETHECERCGGKIRPNVLLVGENYNDDDYNKLILHLNTTHTLITIGLDYKEDTINNLITQYLTKRDVNNTDAVILSILENKELNLNDALGYHNFLVYDNCDSASKRLEKGLGD